MGNGRAVGKIIEPQTQGAPCGYDLPIRTRTYGIPMAGVSPGKLNASRSLCDSGLARRLRLTRSRRPGGSAPRSCATATRALSAPGRGSTLLDADALRRLAGA